MAEYLVLRTPHVLHSPTVLGDHRRVETQMMLSERIEDPGALQLQQPESLVRTIGAG